MTALPAGTYAAPQLPAPALPRLRLTRRGRAVFTTLVALPFVVAALLVGLNGGGAIATSTAPDATFEWVTIEGGQSLWDLAAVIAPNEDPREFAAQVAHLNQLPSSVVQPGQQLAIPTRYTD
jgi:hypothetical protein